MHLQHCFILNFQLQERYDQNPDYVNTPPFSVNPTPHDSRAPSQFRPAPQKANHVSAACSLPNLNHGSQNNGEPAACANMHLIDSCLNNNSANSGHGHANDEGANNSAQIWNRQALNNQVAPGNRANNYWDNFRR